MGDNLLSLKDVFFLRDQMRKTLALLSDVLERERKRLSGSLGDGDLLASRGDVVGREGRAAAEVERAIRGHDELGRLGDGGRAAKDTGSVDGAKTLGRLERDGAAGDLAEGVAGAGGRGVEESVSVRSQRCAKEGNAPGSSVIPGTAADEASLARNGSV